MRPKINVLMNDVDKFIFIMGVSVCLDSATRLTFSVRTVCAYCVVQILKIELRKEQKKSISRFSGRFCEKVVCLLLRKREQQKKTY